tara:strand:- start:659 stop:1372 length:714 start_codon:yes stop_codon:yes gene_type:complete
MLLIDDRENEKVVNKLLMRIGDWSLDPKGQGKVLRMQSADYVIGQWGIEAKEINDLYRSIMGFGRTRTIIDQLRDLQENFDKPFLIVYGTQLKPYVRGKSSRQAMAIEMAKMKKVIDQFKLTFYQRFPKIRYMELPTMDAFVDFLITNHTQMTLDGQSGLNRIPEFVKIKNSKKADDRVNLLTSVGGVTNTMAIDLLEHFGSIPQILHSRRTQKDLMEVKGIGRTKAKKILDLRKKY